ncbi:MAG: class I SAM-dependent methyltransferase [Anaerolineales bacterium]|jgi:SAM-dependent methyltransferase
MKLGGNPESVDYDRLAGSYARRYADSPMSGTELALKALLAEQHPRRVLEAGCGTGHWLQALQGHGAQLFGLDRSMGMLAAAQQYAAAAPLIRGDACYLPFQGELFDLVFVVNALHHFAHPEAFLQAVYRTLQPGGCLALIGTDITHCLANWYVYDYFPEAEALDRQRFPTWEQVAGWLRTAGFVPGGCRVVETFATTWPGRSVFEDPFLQKDSNSTLVLLNDAAYSAGMARLESDVRTTERRGETILFRSKINLCLQTAWKAQGEENDPRN